MNPVIAVFFLVCLSVLAIVQCQPPEGCGPPPGGPPPGGPHGGPHKGGPRGPPPSDLPGCKDYMKAIHQTKRDNNLGGPRNCNVPEERDTCEWQAMKDASEKVETPPTEECQTQAKELFRL